MMKELPCELCAPAKSCAGDVPATPFLLQAGQGKQEVGIFRMLFKTWRTKKGHLPWPSSFSCLSSGFGLPCQCQKKQTRETGTLWHGFRRKPHPIFCSFWGLLKHESANQERHWCWGLGSNVPIFLGPAACWPREPRWSADKLCRTVRRVLFQNVCLIFLNFNWSNWLFLFFHCNMM